MRVIRWPWGGVLSLLALCPAVRAAAPADLLVTDARIYTVDPGRTIAEALVVRDGRSVFVGAARDARAFSVGRKTRKRALRGRLVLAGLFDAHGHPLDIAALDVCDLDNQPVSLRELTARVHSCLARYHTPPGELLIVHQWTYTDGNTPDADAPTLRAALDRASSGVRIQLLGADGHHGAFNSAALASAKNARGETVGLSRRTLDADFVPYRALVGVDAAGEPNGAVNEDARYTISPGVRLYNDLEAVSKVPERIMQ